MTDSFNTNIWLLQSVLIMLAFLLLVPIVRALAGISLIAAGQAFNREHLQRRGRALLPIMMRVMLGVSAMSQPVIAHAQPNAIHVVQPGDSLWSIAADSLAADNIELTPQAIDREWRRLWRLNYDVIGAHPEALKAGQALHLDADDTD